MFQQPTKQELKEVEQAKAGKDSARGGGGFVRLTSPSDAMGGDGMEHHYHLDAFELSGIILNTFGTADNKVT